MENCSAQSGVTKCDIAAWIIMSIALILVIKLHLLPSLLSGLLVYELVHILSRQIHVANLSGQRAKLIAIALLATLIVGLITLAGIGIIAFLRGDTGNLPALLQKLADILDSSRAILPPELASYLPANIDAAKGDIVHWLRSHAGEVQMFGKEAGRTLIHIVAGTIIGAMISMREANPNLRYRALAQSLVERTARLGEAFRRIVFAQVRIAALNALFTGIYLAVILPLAGVHLPFTKTLITITFIMGLLPVIGNLVSNTIIVMVSLQHSIYAALGSLGFLIIIHKLEYFLNAKIVASRIRARAWELLLAMLVMEAAFGLAGIIAAPIYYAYIKDELSSRGLV